MRARRRKNECLWGRIMAVTLQQIAEAAGVSRGTVDRALNNRGRINPEVAQKIKNIAAEMGYQPNRAGRALAMAKRSVKLGIILQSIETPFMQEVLAGVENAKMEVERMGAEVCTYSIKGIDVAQVIRAMEEMRADGFSGIALMPTEDELLKRMINTFVDEYKIPIVTLNADLEGTKRICFVGQDGRKSGRTAAGLIGEIIPEGGKVAVISGHSSNPSLNDRVKGFQQEMKHSFPNIHVLGIRYSYDDNWVAKKIADELMHENPDLDGIYVTAHGEEGVCAALEESGQYQRIKLISHDLVPLNMEYLKKGIINFLIGQDAYLQGHEPIMILFHMFFDGIQPKEEYQFTEIVIKSRYNI